MWLREHRHVGMVFQDYALFPNMTVHQNIRFGIESNPSANERVQELLKLFDLTNLEHRLPNALSGGQQQRVAFSKSTGTQTPISLLDEPFANLDAALRTKVGNEVRAALAQENTAALLVTHDREEALGLADQGCGSGAYRNKCSSQHCSMWKPPSRFIIFQTMK